jgi:nuclear pore complex protein Nup160
MCEDNAVELLMSYNFAGMAEEVEDVLAFKARNIDPRVRPSYSSILYSWYTRKGDHRNGELFLDHLSTTILDVYSRPCHVPACAQASSTH